MVLINSSYTFRSAAPRRRLLSAATCHTGTPEPLDPRVPSHPVRPPRPVHLPLREPPPGCSASPDWGIRSEPPDAAGSGPDHQVARWSGPEPDTPIRTEG